MWAAVIPLIVGPLGTVANDLDTGTRRIANQRKNRDILTYIFILISQNTENSSGDLKKLASVKNFKLTIL